MIWLFRTTNPQGLSGVQKPEDDVEVFCESSLFNSASHSTTVSSKTGNKMLRPFLILRNFEALYIWYKVILTRTLFRVLKFLSLQPSVFHPEL